VLAGPSGVGKTRLGNECLAVAEQAGLATAQATATRSAAQLPFGAVAPLLAEDAPEPGASDDRVDLLRRSVAAFAERAEGRPLLLFVDDAHLLDDASATFVHQVAATGAALVLATVTAGEPAPDPIVALWKDDLVERVELAGLRDDAIDELLPTVLEAAVDPATAAQFRERCRGNALFLRELVMGALDDGSLHDDDGIWRLERPLAPSARLVEIVEARLGRLDDDERALVELVAYGEPLGQAELAGLSDPAVAEALERRALLASDVDGRRLAVHLAHPLYGDVVRARTPALRARTIARCLADAVEATSPSRRDDVLRVANWRLQAGDGSPELLLDGARIARWRYDFDLAERLARAALDAGAGFDAALLAARCASLQGRTDEAEAELAALAARPDAGSDARRGQVAIARFDNLAVWTGRDELRILDEAEAHVTDPAWRDQLAARRVSVVLNTQGPRAGAEAARPLLEHATGEALVFASLAASFGLARMGRLDEAREVAARGEAARQALDEPLDWYPWWHTLTECFTLLWGGRFEEAEELVAEQHRQAVDEGSHEAQALFASLTAHAVGDRGRVRTAAERARESLVLDQRLGRQLLVRQDRIVAALALALAGRADEATAELAAIDELALPPLMRDQVDLLTAQAWTCAAAGDPPVSGDLLLQAAELGEEVGDLVGTAAALHGLARMGRAAEVVDRLADLASRVDGDLVPARARHAEALARADAEALEKASDDFEAMGADLLAAEAASDAAVARRQAGQVREAAAAERRAGILVERCEYPTTPALQATEARARLTPAERATAVLASAGRTNRDIAEQLVLSPRTVENRLQRVYEKLGVSGRTELSEALTLDTPDDPT
jgi:DNA-binding CsgD family transcriptional regulator